MTISYSMEIMGVDRPWHMLINPRCWMEREKNFSGERQGSDKNITAPIIMIPAVMSATWFFVCFGLVFWRLREYRHTCGAWQCFFLLVEFFVWIESLFGTGINKNPFHAPNPEWRINLDAVRVIMKWNQLSHAKKKRPYFPLNPACLVLVMVYCNPHITG